MTKKNNHNFNNDVLMITGNPRSGTTMLRNFIDSHPDCKITNEFNNFKSTDLPYYAYIKDIIKIARINSYRSFFYSNFQKTSKKTKIKSYLFVLNYILNILLIHPKRVDSQVIGQCLRKIFPSNKIVGDKMPSYLQQLPKFVKEKKLKIIVIYRDCRDVVNSTIRVSKSSSNWKNIKIGNIEGITQKWINGIEVMEKYSNTIHIIRYENFIKHLDHETHRISKFLNIAHDEFDKTIIRSNSINRHKKDLLINDEDFNRILQIAQPAMSKLGYI